MQKPEDEDDPMQGSGEEEEEGEGEPLGGGGSDDSSEEPEEDEEEERRIREGFIVDEDEEEEDGGGGGGGAAAAAEGMCDGRMGRGMDKKGNTLLIAVAPQTRPSSGRGIKYAEMRRGRIVSCSRPQRSRTRRTTISRNGRHPNELCAIYGPTASVRGSRSPKGVHDQRERAAVSGPSPSAHCRPRRVEHGSERARGLHFHAYDRAKNSASGSIVDAKVNRRGAPSRVQTRRLWSLQDASLPPTARVAQSRQRGRHGAFDTSPIFRPLSHS